MKPRHKRYSDVEGSDSEEELAPYEKKLIAKAVGKDRRDSSEEEDEEDVYGVASDTSSSSDIAESDVEGNDETTNLPDARAWGKNKHNYYSTDYVDPDYGGYQEKGPAPLADLEEAEAKTLQRYLIEQLDDDDFSFESLTTKAHHTGDEHQQQQTEEEVIKADISVLSKKQKIALLAKESPEFFGLVEDFKKNMAALAPIIRLLTENNKVKTCEALNFIKTHHQIVLNYCTNISMYLLLKASDTNMQNHPVIKRLYQYRNILSQLGPIFEEIIRPQIDSLLERSGEADTKTRETHPLKKHLKILAKDKTDRVRAPARKSEVPEMMDDPDSGSGLQREPVEEEIVDNSNETLDATESRRAISYQIAKNKGLTPHRNKLQRNPRVKHRDKYRKAKIRRKGAVREVRRELARYGGEISGIKASVTKSVKIRS